MRQKHLTGNMTLTFTVIIFSQANSVLTDSHYKLTYTSINENCENLALFHRLLPWGACNPWWCGGIPKECFGPCKGDGLPVLAVGLGDWRPGLGDMLGSYTPSFCVNTESGAWPYPILPLAPPTTNLALAGSTSFNFCLTARARSSSSVVKIV